MESFQNQEIHGKKPNQPSHSEMREKSLRGAAKSYKLYDTDEEDAKLALFEDSGSDYEKELIKNKKSLLSDSEDETDQESVKKMKKKSLLAESEDDADQGSVQKKKMNVKKQRDSFLKKPNFEEINALAEKKGLDKDTIRKRTNVEEKIGKFLKKNNFMTLDQFCNDEAQIDQFQIGKSNF